MSEHNQQFDNFSAWVNKASSWLTRHEKFHEVYFRAMCADSKGRICSRGEHFMRARDEGTFPIRWWWPDQTIHELDISHQSSRVAELEIELENANNRAANFKAQLPESPVHKVRREAVEANPR